MFWSYVTQIFSFTGITDITVWQDVFVSAILIPIVLYLGNLLLSWWNSIRPSSQLFKKCLDKNSDVFIFHSQMSGADDNWNFNPNQKYITRYPDPRPSNSANLAVQKKLNIDPILSQAESECLADVYNIMGKVGKVRLNIADLINDWNVWSNPIFTIGFNPKTLALIEKCEPVYFELISGHVGMNIKIKETNIQYNSVLPNDAGIIQKTFIQNTDYPVYILAGIGTMGTSGAGYVLRENFIDFGKLYGNNPFCIFFEARVNEGRAAATIKKIYPEPKWYKVIFAPLVYYRYRKKGCFIYSD